MPHASIGSDVIVGFPGETEADFQETLAVMRAARFDHIYAFKFSARHDTPARDYPDQVPEAEKADRLARLHALHESILGEHLVLARRFAEAGTLLLKGERGLVAIRGGDAPIIQDARGRLVKLYEAWGKPEEAAAWRSKLKPATAP